MTGSPIPVIINTGYVSNHYIICPYVLDIARGKIYNQYLTNIRIRRLHSIMFDIRLFAQNQLVNQTEHRQLPLQRMYLRPLLVPHRRHSVSPLLSQIKTTDSKRRRNYCIGSVICVRFLSKIEKWGIISLEISIWNSTKIRPFDRSIPCRLPLFGTVLRIYIPGYS